MEVLRGSTCKELRAQESPPGEANKTKGIQEGFFCITELDLTSDEQNLEDP